MANKQPKRNLQKLLEELELAEQSDKSPLPGFPKPVQQQVSDLRSDLSEALMDLEKLGDSLAKRDPKDFRYLDQSGDALEKHLSEIESRVREAYMMLQYLYE